MIRLKLEFDSSGRLVRLKAVGHAGFGNPGRDIVCSAVTSTVRTFCRLAEGTDGIDSTGNVGPDDSMELKIRSVEPGRLVWYQGITDFFMCAITDLQSEYPDNISVETRIVHG